MGESGASSILTRKRKSGIQERGRGLPMNKPAKTKTRLVWRKAAAMLLLVAGLTTAFWFASSPMALGRLMSPTEMIEANLPPGIMLKTAAKPQFLTAVCGAVKSHRKDAPAIARVAVLAHRDYAGDIVATVVRCLGQQDCELTAMVVSAAVAARPDLASTITDAAIAVAPDCADAIQAALSGEGREAIEPDGKESLPDIPAEGPPPTNVQPPPFVGGGGGGFSPQETVVLVCDNGRERRVRETQLGNFLDAHPGAVVGTCQITPVTSR